MLKDPARAHSNVAPGLRYGHGALAVAHLLDGRAFRTGGIGELIS